MAVVWGKPRRSDQINAWVTEVVSHYSTRVVLLCSASDALLQPMSDASRTHGATKEAMVGDIGAMQNWFLTFPAHTLLSASHLLRSQFLLKPSHSAHSLLTPYLPMSCFTSTPYSKPSKHSLSHALSTFLPLAGNLLWPPQSPEPFICYNPGDSLSLTIAKTHADFHHLSSNSCPEGKGIPFPRTRPPNIRHHCSSHVSSNHFVPQMWVFHWHHNQPCGFRCQNIHHVLEIMGFHL
ncbi:BAHD acyltransferase, partial [Cucurbita argyrosperma subsp. argyrosperma]